MSHLDQPGSRLDLPVTLILAADDYQPRPSDSISWSYSRTRSAPVDDASHWPQWDQPAIEPA